MHPHSDKPAPLAPMPKHPVSARASAVFDALTCLPGDFMDAGRADTPPQQRAVF